MVSQQSVMLKNLILTKSFVKRSFHMASLSAEDATQVAIVALISIALYNVAELNFIIATTFKRRSGLYFWSFIVATWGIAFNAIGYLLKHLELVQNGTTYATIIIIGWCSMVTGQSFVLYSRLHLLLHNQYHLRLVLGMIIFNAIAMHVPVTALVYGSFGPNPEPYLQPYTIYEKVQLSVFFIQETIISGLYVYETYKLLRLKRAISGSAQRRKLMSHLIFVNIAVIFLDISILVLEFANYYNLQTAWKPLVYSVKLKAEFNILNKLVDFTQISFQNSSSARSQVAKNGDASCGIITNMAMETFSGIRCNNGSENNDGKALGYKAHASGARNLTDRKVHHHTSGGILQHVEVAIKTERVVRDEDMGSIGSLGQGSDISTKQDMKSGEASSVSSETRLHGADSC